MWASSYTKYIFLPNPFYKPQTHTVLGCIYYKTLHHGLLKIRPDLLLLQPKASRPVFHFLLTGLEIFEHAYHEYPISYTFYYKFIVDSYYGGCQIRYQQ